MGTKKGLVFSKNVNPLPNEEFIFKSVYRFIPEFETCPINNYGEREKRTVTTFIELTIYPHQACVISFYNKGFARGKKKYKVRCRLSPGHIKAIVRACVDAFFDFIDTNGHHSFIFHAVDDFEGHTELNKRFTLYTRFIDTYFRDRQLYDNDGSIQLNTFMLMHKEHPFKVENLDFFIKYQKRVEEEIFSEDEDEKE